MVHLSLDMEMRGRYTWPSGSKANRRLQTHLRQRMAALLGRAKELRWMEQSSGSKGQLDESDKEVGRWYVDW